MEKPSRLYLSPPYMGGGESEAVADVFASNWIAPVGPHLDKFEQIFTEYVGLKSAVALASGTAAIHLALRHLGVGQDDEVLCPTLTFCASANPILYEHAKPVLIDADPRTWCVDPALLADELKACDRRGKLPRAIIVVDLLGQSADMDAILELAARYDVAVIEDAAEALGATYRDRSAGSSGWMNAFSFNGNKIITTSGGGMLASNDEAAIEHARYLSTQARDPGHLYQHSECGFNYRLSNVLAAIGVAQMGVLDQRVRTRRLINERYRDDLQELPGISFLPEADYGRSNHWLTVICVDAEKFGATCEDVRVALEAENIESRRIWVPLHMQKPFSGCRVRGTKVAESLFDSALCLPSGSDMTSDDLGRVIACIRRCFQL